MYGPHSPDDLVENTLDFMPPASAPEARAYLASIIIKAGDRISDVESKEAGPQGNIKDLPNSMTTVVIDGRPHRIWGVATPY